jgi:hypothetical protein
MNHPTDPREMRKVLDAIAFRGASLQPDGKEWEYSYASATVRQCMDLGRHQGLSGEDTMTLIAYHLLVRCDSLSKLALQNAVLNPTPKLKAGVVPATMENPMGAGYA